MKQTSFYLAVLLSASITPTTTVAAVVIQADYDLGVIAFSSDDPVIDSKDSKDRQGNIFGTPVNISDSLVAERAAGSATAIARAKAQAGSVGVAVSLSATGEYHPDRGDGNPRWGTGIAGARARATWSDTFMLEVPTLPKGYPLVMGTVLNLDFDTFDFLGKISGEGRRAELYLYINDLTPDHALPPSPYGGNVFGKIEGTPNSGDITPDYPPAMLPLRHQMVNGVSYTIGFIVGMEGFVYADPPGVAQVAGTFDSSLDWGGVVSVSDGITGEALTNWTITSESGFDYSKPFSAQVQTVPEPSSFVLLFFGSAIFGSCRVGTRKWRRSENSFHRRDDRHGTVRNILP